MAKHFIGTTIEGVRARFAREMDDKEFESMLEQVGGELPRGFFAWHFEDGVDHSNSPKAKTVARLPIITELSGKFADPAAEVIRAKKNEEGAG